MDEEWPEIKREIQRWLDPENFDMHGQQLTKLNTAQTNSRRDKTMVVKEMQ